MTAEMVKTPPVTRATIRFVIVAAVISAVVACVLFPLLTTEAYAWALTIAVAGSGGALAIIDIRTLTLPNRYVAAIVSAGLVQAAASSIAHHQPHIFWDAVIAAMLVWAMYVVLGLAGWFGFGDAKFAAALTSIVAIYAGFEALYVVPAAIMMAALSRTIPRDTGGRAHGPAIALSATLLMIGTVTSRF
jgi:leader peptidase (prepilin peptidase)/N-methyltransferase